MKVEFCLHQPNKRDRFAELSWHICPRIGEKVLFNTGDPEWTVRDVVHDFDADLVHVLCVAIG
jgi:hypothetical protein